MTDLTAAAEFVFEATVQAPPGTYPATVKSVEAVELDTRDGLKQLVRWTFEAVTADGEVIEVDGLSSRNTSPRAKSVRWLTALGRKPSQGKPTSPEELAGLPCMVILGVDENGFQTLEDVVAPLAAPSK